MAEEKKAADPLRDFWIVLGFFALMVALWFFSGANSLADLRGIFLAPPQPVGSGEAYGPQGSANPANELPPPPTYETNNAY